MTFNRRKFMQFATAPFILEGLLEASPLGMPQSLTGGSGGIEKIPHYAALQKLWAMTGEIITDWKWHPDNLPHPEAPTLNDSDWEKYTVHEQEWLEFYRSPWGAVVGNGAIWFRTWVEIPQSIGGYKIEGLPAWLDLRVQHEARGRIAVFSNGALIEMNALNIQQPIPLMDQAQPGRKFLIAAYSPGPGSLTARLEVKYPAGQSNPETMFQEILSVMAASSGFPDGQSQRNAQLTAAIAAISFDALDRGDHAAFNRSLTTADQKMQPLAQWIKQFTILAVGQSHIDLAWLWPWVETVEVVRNTFASALELMNEYPQLTYAQSSSQDFLWLERYYPREFEEIQRRVKEGRWELVGGMWCEPDLNIPCGESLVRQLLTGKRYFQQKFGVDVKIGWNPDSFGYSWQLAQIYKRSGVNYFVTQKLSANETTRFPYKLFQWESPDGSRVLTSFPRMGDLTPVQCAEQIAVFTPMSSGFKTQILLYGVGDHGGGPTRQMLDTAIRWQQSPKAAFPNLKLTTAQAYFDDVDNNLAGLNLPVWRSELYFQHHRGTYTSQAETKRRMRRSEELLLSSEKFSALAMLTGRLYPQRKFEDCWRRVCFNQFHDQMAGTGIHINYHDEAESLEFVKDALTPELEGSLRHFAARVDTRGAGVPVIAFNPLSWVRTDIVEVEAQFPRPVAKVEVSDPEGNVMPSAETSRNNSTNTVRVRFLARAVPPVGYKVFHLLSANHPRQAVSSLRASGLKVENEFLSLEVDPKTGCVTSLVSKKDGKNILREGGKGNLLETFVDKQKTEEAWNIDWPYEQSKKELLEAEEVKLTENTPVRAVVRVKKSFQNSSFVQDICLYPEAPRADVHMHADWHEHETMLKVAFPLAIAPLNATYEIPYGTIERPAIPHMPGKPPVPFTDAINIRKEGQRKYEPLLAQEAEFEVCAQRWGDLSENGRGFSLLNNCKYGYDTVEPGTIRLTLLRSPISPVPSKDPYDLWADQGPHDFTYAMYPHAGGWREAGTERQGYELNYPVLARPVQPHEGTLPPSHSFVRIEPANVILTAIKKAEDDNSLIFRFFEFEGKDSQVQLAFTEAATAAVQTNLMEKEESPLALGAGGRQLLTPIGHYEIKSVKVMFANAAGSTPPRRV
jgi:alpha-mannosidase